MRDSRLLERTIKCGKVVPSPYFRMHYLEGGGPPRVAFLAGRKVGTAVRRNRARRRIREAYRTSRADLPHIEALVFVVKDRILAAPFSSITDALRDALHRAVDQAS